MVTSTLLLAAVTSLAAAQYGPGGDAPRSARRDHPPVVDTTADDDSGFVPYSAAASSSAPESAPPPVSATAPASAHASAPPPPAAPSPPTAASPADSEPSPASRPAQSSRSSADEVDRHLKLCAQLLADDRPQAAALCYRTAAHRAPTAEQVAVAESMAQLALDMVEAGSPPEPELAREERRSAAPEIQERPPAQRSPSEFTDWILRRGALSTVGTSGLYGMWLGGVAGSMLPASTEIMFPMTLMGGLFGAATATGVLGIFPDFSGGDTALLRSSMVMGFGNSIVAALLANATLEFEDRALLTPALMLGISSLTVGAAAAVTPFIELPAGGVALATSGATWSWVLGLLTLLSASGDVGFLPSLGLASGAANLVWAGLLVASPWMPVTRLDTWLMDLGCGVGLVGGMVASLFVMSAVGAGPASFLIPTAFGTVAGGGAALLASIAARDYVDTWTLFEDPDAFAVAPFVAPGAGGDDAPVVGGSLMWRW